MSPGAHNSFSPSHCLTLGTAHQTLELTPLKEFINTDTLSSLQTFRYNQLIHFLNSKPDCIVKARTQSKFETYCTLHKLSNKQLFTVNALLHQDHTYKHGQRILIFT
ncbi:Hypothetical predicted protein [Pelobates cultripes]|uniref:Uncharacterized protein n=1 Tax=Pelobates cultripes TaxID=61616 RepID=A0AAD1ST51_PELCU|nr:Hypothetical predicted protein [Pelobates cultripes]